MTRFDLVIQGFKLNGAEPLSRVLERVLGCSGEEAKALGKRFPSVLRRELEPAQATALAEVLRAAGARIELVESGTAPSAVVPAQVAVQAVSAEQATPKREGGASKYLLGTLKIMLNGPPPRPAAAANPGVASAELAANSGNDAPAPKRESLVGKYVMGTLRIVLNGPPPPPEPVATKPEPQGPAPAHEAGVLDDVLNPTGDQAELEIDEGALNARNYVSGGRGDVQRPSLMMRMVDIPARVVRRAARPKDPEEEVEAPRRARWLVPALVACGAIFIVGASVAAIGRPTGGSRAEAQSQSVGGANGEDPSAGFGEQQGGEQPASARQDEGGATHPLLVIAPKPMEPALASILRRQVAGTSAVAIDWPTGEKPDGSVQCMVVGGTSSQREERVATLLKTGKRVQVSPAVESQMRDHAEVLRAADNSPNAQYALLCLQN